MQSDDKDSHVKLEIQKTLISIKQLTLNIKDELDAINDFVKQLGKTVDSTNKTLTTVAEDMGIDVDNIVSEATEENEFHLNLRNLQNSVEFQDKLVTYLNNM